MSMKGKWLYTALCVWLICLMHHMLTWILFPFFFVFLNQRLGKWSWFMLCILICFQLRTLPIIPVPPANELQVTVKEIKANSIIAQTSDQRIILYGLENAGLQDTFHVQVTCKPLSFQRNFGLFDFTKYYQKRSIYYACDAKKAKRLKQGSGLQAKLWNHIENLDAPYQTFLKQSLFGIHEEENASYLIRSSGLHLSFLASQCKMILMMFCSPLMAGIVSLLLITGIGALTYWKESLARLLIFRFMQTLFPTWDRKDQLGFSMMMILFIYPYIADELCFVLPVMFRMVSLFQTHKRNRILISCLILIPMQFYYMHEVDPVHILLFPLLRAFYAYGYLCTWLLCLFQSQAMLSFLQMMYKTAQFFEQDCSLYYQASLCFLLIWFYFVFRYISRNKKKDVWILLMLMIYTQCAAFFHPYMEILMIDVGQGDCFLITLPFHQGNILIDAAGSENKDLANDVIIPVLQAKGITSLDLVIITHDDLDHNGSLSSIQQQISIKRIITEKQQKELHFGNFTLHFLLQEQTFDNKNDNSLIVYMHAFDTDLLFMGDAGANTERAIMREYPNLRADILKVAHHGSKTASTRAFLHQLHPLLALISCGANNRYGHPHEETIDSLNKEQIHMLNTANHGAISIKLTNFIRFYKTTDDEFGIISTGD